MEGGEGGHGERKKREREEKSQALHTQGQQKTAPTSSGLPRPIVCLHWTIAVVGSVGVFGALLQAVFSGRSLSSVLDFLNKPASTHTYTTYTHMRSCLPLQNQRTEVKGRRGLKA